MHALIAEADWSPRDGYRPSEWELRTHIARNASQVWKNPRLVTKEIPVPKPGPYEVLLKVKVCGICGSDVHEYHAGPGDTDADNDNPSRPEFIGEPAYGGRGNTAFESSNTGGQGRKSPVQPQVSSNGFEKDGNPVSVKAMTQAGYDTDEQYGPPSEE